MFNQMESAMQQEKFRKVLNVIVGLSLAAAAGIAGFLIGGGGAPSAKGLADFRAWEAEQAQQVQQTRQEGHSAAQTGRLAP